MNYLLLWAPFFFNASLFAETKTKEDFLKLYGQKPNAFSEMSSKDLEAELKKVTAPIDQFNRNFEKRPTLNAVSAAEFISDNEFIAVTMQDQRGYGYTSGRIISRVYRVGELAAQSDFPVIVSRERGFNFENIWINGAKKTAILLGGSSAGQVLQFLNLEAGQVEWTHTLKENAKIPALAFRRSKTGGKVAYFYRQTLKVIDVEKKKEKEWPQTQTVTALLFSEDESHVLIGFDNGVVSEMDLSTGEKKHQWVVPTEEGSTRVITSLAYSPDGEISAGTWSGRFLRWRKEEPKPFQNVIVVPADDQTTDTSLKQIKWHPEGELVAVAGGYQEGVLNPISFWNLRKDQWLLDIKVSNPKMYSFSPDGKKFLMVTHANQLYVWSFDKSEKE